MLSFISANIRNCLRPSCTVQGLEQMLYLSRLLTDETVLDRILPYVVYFLCDEAAVVRSMAIRSLTQLVRSMLAGLRTSLQAEISRCRSFYWLKSSPQPTLRSSWTTSCPTSVP